MDNWILEAMQSRLWPEKFLLQERRGAQSVGILFLLLNYQSCLAGHVMKTRWRAFQLCL